MTRDEIYEANPDAILLEPPEMDVAILGVVEQCGKEPVALYSYDRLVKYFVDGGMDQEDAEEWVSVNILGAYMGPGTPMYLTAEAGAAA